MSTFKCIECGNDRDSDDDSMPFGEGEVCRDCMDDVPENFLQELRDTQEDRNHWEKQARRWQEKCEQIWSCVTKIYTGDAKKTYEDSQKTP